MSTSDRIAVVGIGIAAIIPAIQLIFVVLGYFKITKSINDRTLDFRAMVDTVMAKVEKRNKRDKTIMVVLALLAGVFLILGQIVKRRGPKP